VCLSELKLCVDGISSNDGQQLGSQSIYASIEQTFSPSDLGSFQSNFGLISKSVSQVIGGHNLDATCVSSPSSCMESNLDVQYIMAVAQNVPTTYYYDTSGNFLRSWAASLLQMSSPPLVHSISYVTYETSMDSSYIASFDNSAVMLASLGVTILAATGDDGVAGYKVRSPATMSCGYWPMWPASSPYVLALGGTQGPEVGSAEVACSTSTNGGI
jgi:subtilase family serine protease